MTRKKLLIKFLSPHMVHEIKVTKWITCVHHNLLSIRFQGGMSLHTNSTLAKLTYYFKELTAPTKVARCLLMSLMMTGSRELTDLNDTSLLAILHVM